MKLAEALVLRADAQRQINALQNRLIRVARVQEGDAPVEDPQELLQELDETSARLENLIQQINYTNSVTVFEDRQTITDALATRDVLMIRRNVFQALVNAAAQQQIRYGNSEIRVIATVDVAMLQRQVDDLSRQYRELDTQIQQQNWLVDLIESKPE